MLKYQLHTIIKRILKIKITNPESRLLGKFSTIPLSSLAITPSELENPFSAYDREELEIMRCHLPMLCHRHHRLGTLSTSPHHFLFSIFAGGGHPALSCVGVVTGEIEQR